MTAPHRPSLICNCVHNQTLVQRLLSSLCLPLLLVPQVRCEDTVSESVLLHNGVLAKPRADLSFWEDRLRLHPYTLAGVGFDNNPLQLQEGSPDDRFSEAAAGCIADLDSASGDCLSLTGALFSRQYQTNDGRELEGGSFSARFLHEGLGTRLTVRAKWDRSDDPTIEIGRSLERDRFVASLGAVMLGEMTHLETEVRTQAVDYREDSPAFTSDERDQLGADWRWTLTRMAGDGAEVGANITGFTSHYLEEVSPYQGHIGWRAEVQVRLEIGQHLRLGGSLGMESRIYQSTYREDPVFQDERCLEPVGQLNLRYTYSVNGRLDMALTSGIADSLTSNYARAESANVSATQRLDLRFSASVSARWSTLDDIAEGPVARARERRMGGSMTAALRDGITVDLSLHVRYYDPNPDQAYQQAVVAHADEHAARIDISNRMEGGVVQGAQVSLSFAVAV